MKALEEFLLRIYDDFSNHYHSTYLISLISSSISHSMIDLCQKLDRVYHLEIGDSGLKAKLEVFNTKNAIH